MRGLPPASGSVDERGLHVMTVERSVIMWGLPPASGSVDGRVPCAMTVASGS